MFDIAWSELLIIAALAIVVVGPKDLPRMMRGFGRMMRKVRTMAREFQSGMNELAREADLEDVQKSVNEIKGFTPTSAAKKAARKMIDPTGALDEPIMGEGFMGQEIEKQEKTKKAKAEAEAETKTADVPETETPEVPDEPGRKGDQS